MAVILSIVLYFVLVVGAIAFNLPPFWQFSALIVLPSVLYGIIISLIVQRRRRALRKKQKKENSSSELPLDVAFRILGLSTNASVDDVHKAHLALIKLSHPDTGGATHLAKLINEAKTIVTKHLSA